MNDKILEIFKCFRVFYDENFYRGLKARFVITHYSEWPASITKFEFSKNKLSFMTDSFDSDGSVIMVHHRALEARPTLLMVSMLL